MLPTRAERLILGSALAADTSIAPAAVKNKTVLIAAPFALTEGLVIEDLTQATFNGSAPIAGALGPQQVGLDPITGEQIVTIVEPAGGWRYVCGVAPAEPETIYGYALTNGAVDLLYAAEVLPTPITITLVGDEINLGSLTFRINLQPMT